MRHRFPPLLACLLLSACVPGGGSDDPAGPADAARRFHEARLAGDAAALRSMLSLGDAQVAARYLGTDTLPDLGFEASGEPGARVDSVRVRSAAGDTAEVETFLTVPAWERVGGRFDETRTPRVDRARDSATVAALPRVPDVRTQRFVREDGEWKAVLRLGDRVAFDRHWIAMRDDTLPLPVRMGHAEALLSDTARPPADGSWRGMVAEFLAGARVADSLRITVERRPRGPASDAEIVVANPTAAPVRLLDVQVRDARGDVRNHLFIGIPPRGRRSTYLAGRVALPVQEVRITDIELGET